MKLVFVSLTKPSGFLGCLLVIWQFGLDHVRLGTTNTLGPLWGKWDTFLAAV